MKITNVLPIILLLASCSDAPREEVALAEGPDTVVETAAAEPSIESTATSPLEEVLPSVPEEAPLMVDLDWSQVPVSSADIGTFPYLTAPEGYVILKNGHTAVSETGYSDFAEFSQLLMFDGASFSQAEGKKAELQFGMKGKVKWDAYRFDRSIEDYLASIGAQLIFKGKIPSKLLKMLNEEDKLNVHQFIQGDPWNKSPVRHYMLNHQSGQFVFQVWSNTASGEVGVVEVKRFVQTIKAPTASEIMQDIDASGKAVLHILFDTNKATLKAEGQQVVDEIQKLLESNAALNLSIEGHTDNTGTGERNKALSIERANAVMYSLAAKGIDIKRLKAAGFGADKPIAANDTEENKAQNRRVELVKF